ASKRDGWCYVWTSDKLSLERGIAKIGEAPWERSARSSKINTRERLGVCVERRRSLAGMLGKLMFFRHHNRWNPVLPENATGIRDVWIGGRLWARQLVKPPGCHSIDPQDTFVRA